MIKLKLELTEEQLTKLGIEIIAGMKASAYEVPIELGRIMALEDTDTSIEFSSEEHRRFVSHNKLRLERQAQFIGKLAMVTINQMDLPTIHPQKVDDTTLQMSQHSLIYKQSEQTYKPLYLKLEAYPVSQPHDALYKLMLEKTAPIFQQVFSMLIERELGNE